MMSWPLVIVVLLAIVLGLYLLLIKQRKTPPPKKHQQKKNNNGATTTQARGKYHCVTVHGNSTVCEGIKQLQGKSLLPHEAPSLPLAHCNMQPCKCHYIHHEDRRLRSRREPYGEFNNSTIAATDRPSRSRVDRRKST